MYICIQLLYSNKSMYIKRNIDDDDNKEYDDYDKNFNGKLPVNFFYNKKKHK